MKIETPPSGALEVEVLLVIDGDSFVGQYRGRTLLFQLDCVQAPELEQQFGEQARDRLAHWIEGRSVLLEWLPIHISSVPWDRVPIIVQVKDSEGFDPASRLTGEGLLWPTCNRYEPLRRAARAKEVGLWSGRNPVPPWDDQACRPSTSSGEP